VDTALDWSRLVAVLLSLAGFIPSVLLVHERRMTFGQALMYHVWLAHTLAFSLYTFVANTLHLIPLLPGDDATLWTALLRNHGVIMAAGYALLLLLERREWGKWHG